MVEGVPEVRDTFGVAACLQKAKDDGFDNQGCFQDYFLKGQQANQYFEYSNITETNPDSSQIHACMTFSGGAEHPDPAVASQFKACLEGYDNATKCDIPSIMWSGRSTNRVPVASYHTLVISNMDKRKEFAENNIANIRGTVLTVLEEIANDFDGRALSVSVFSSDGDVLHQCADCILQGPFGRAELTPGPDGVEKVIWSRASDGSDTRQFDLPCSGDKLSNRDGNHDTKPPFTCGTYARKSVLKYFLRDAFGGTENQTAKDQVIAAVKKLVNETREAWSNDANFLCTCKNGTTGWACCAEQSDCATEPCKCDDSYTVPYSVACCTNVCPGLAPNGLMKPYSYLSGSEMGKVLLSGLASYLNSLVWTKNDPWLKYDPLGYEAYRSSWLAAGFQLADMGLFGTTENVVYYDETTHPFNTTFWDYCAGLLQQVMWTMPVSRTSGRPKFTAPEYDPVDGESYAADTTYREEFIQRLTLEAYRQSPLYWHYSVRYTPSNSSMCQRTSSVQPLNTTFPLKGSSGTTYQIKQFGLPSLTLGGIAGADCHCGWWKTSKTCQIPAALCARMVQLLGFYRICVDQNQMYNSSDHFLVLDALDSLLAKDPLAPYTCPSMQVSDHWGFNTTSTGQLVGNATDYVLNEGVAGFRYGNTDWMISSQSQYVNPRVRAKRYERTARAKVSLDCNPPTTSIADHFVDDLFPAAQGVRQSAPQSYCTRYGIELARLTMYDTMQLDSSLPAQQAVVSKWKTRCQFKLRQIATCKKHRVLSATGPPTDASKCPFTLTISPTYLKNYAVTPGCLVIVWNPTTAVSSIYDPCVCNDCSMDSNKANIQVPMSSLCLVTDPYTLVADDVIIGENPSDVDMPIGRGSFANLLSKTDQLKVNTPPADTAHWAVKTAILHADLLLDYWPDEWKQPVGYHVTPSCSLTNDAHWKTFDSAWRWDSTLERMVYTPEVSDPLLSRNSFGASGFCRTHNYGMPMTTLNTMRTCTKENSNAQADPMVPAPPTERAWVDGSEYCSDSPFKTPWNYTTLANTPNQWSVGTLQRGPLSPFYATEWGEGCSPYPFRPCVVDAECASGLKCLKSQGTTGVCGVMAANNFECAMHSQCDGDKMCTGDGLCVEGVWHVVNNLKESVSFRTHSQTCSTGNPLDTWGTSSMESVPDILSASGLCSYRSWMENRRMAVANKCENSNTCPNFQGVYPWNHSSPRMPDQSDAFSSDVLKVLPHVCDRDYQHYEGFKSCTPNDNYIGLRYTATGLPLAKPSAGWKRGNRTQTYRSTNNRQLPLMHHTENANGATVGFIGIDGKTYADLKLGTASPDIMSCSSMKVCGFQNQFRVNNIIVSSSARQVLDNGMSRGYTMNDLLSCGAYGYFSSTSQLCRIDFAVVPFAHLYLNVYKSDWSNKVQFSSIASSLTTDTYTTANRVSRMTALNALPDAIMAYFIGGAPTTFQDYVDKSQKFVDLYANILSMNMPVYTDAGSPRQLYYLTQYGVYEVPFAWWYKCVWLKGYVMSTDPIVSEAGCDWHQPQGAYPDGTVFEAFNSKLSTLFGLDAPVASAVKVTKMLKDVLLQLPGRVTQQALNNALSDYTAKRNYWIGLINAKIDPVVEYMCFKRKDYVPEYNQMSQRYQIGRINAYYATSDGFDVLSPYYSDDDNKTMVCDGNTCFQSAEPTVPLTSNANFASLLRAALTDGSPVVLNAQTVLLTANVPDDDLVTLSNLFTVMDTYQYDTIAQQFNNKADGCSTRVSIQTTGVEKYCLCRSWGGCAASVQDAILRKAKLTDGPQPTVTPLIKLTKTDGSNAIPEIDACTGASSLMCEDKCMFGSEAIMSDVTDITLPIGTVAETYDDMPWDCTYINCMQSSIYSGTYQPYPYSTNIMNDGEMIDVVDYNFTQAMRDTTDNQWTDASEATETQAWIQEKNDIMCYDADVLTKGAYRFPQRTVTYKGTVMMNARNIDYYLNDSLVASVVMFPCGYSSDFLTTWNNLNKAGGYRKLTGAQGWMCETTGKGMRSKWTGFMPEYIRTYTPLPSDGGPKTSAEIRRVMDRIRYIISSIEGKVPANELCLRNNGQCDVIVSSTERGSVTSRLWDADENKEACAAVRDDYVFGCRMWPGENMYHITKSLYNYRSGWNSWELKDGRFNCGNVKDSTKGNNVDYFHPSIHACFADDASDPCKNNAEYGSWGWQHGAFRDSKVSGRITTYTYFSQRKACYDTGAGTCGLTQESGKLPTPAAACPGKPGDDSAKLRRASYVKALGNKLHTGITWLQTLQTSGKSSVDVFSHVYLGLKPGYKCGKCVNSNGDCTTTCPAPIPPACTSTQITFEALRNLFLCVDCPMVSATYCLGQHNCQMSSPVIPVEQLNYMSDWSNLTAAARDYLTGTSGHAVVGIAIEAFRWLAKRVLEMGIPSVSLPYDVPAFMTSFSYKDPYSYNPLAIITYSKGMEVAASKCASTGLMPDFTNCSYDGRRRNLRSFVRANYKVSDGLVIDSGVTLLWKMLRSQMMAQSIPAWEAYNNKTDMFLNDLFDDKWCAKGSMQENLCYKRTVGSNLVVDVLNPGLLGMFEPRMGCDTEYRNKMLVVSSSCSNCNSDTFDMNTIENGGMMPCYDGDSVSGVSESLEARSNLCGRVPEYVSQCPNRQGMLGQVQSTSDGNTISSLYSHVQWSTANSLPTGLNANTLFQGKTPASGTVSNLALSPYDIGGHFLRMSLEMNKDSNPVLKIVGMPLISYGQNVDALSDVAYGMGQSTSTDLRWLQRSQQAAEVDALRKMYPDPVCKTWDCPLRRRAFYNGKDANFRPKVPDPSRTQILYGSRSHPTQEAYTLKMNFRLGGAPILGLYQTSNGFCACAASTCPGCLDDTDALAGNWKVASVLPAGVNTCKMQLDWPYVGGTLRDKSAYNERYGLVQSCGVLDRLPTFRYRYWNSGIPTPLAKTTLDKGGACHTGWPFINAGPLANCYLLAETDMFVCKNVNNVPTSYAKARLRARTVAELIAQSTSRRMKLTECKAPPTYQMGSSTVPSEASYGQLKRLEASRLLAKDLRSKLCGNNAACLATKDWQLPTFWQSVFTKNFPSLPSDSGANLTLWNTSWVACLQGKNGTQECDGTVSRADWMSANRGAKCVDAITSSSLASKLIRDIDVCNMDTTLDRFCRTVQDGRYGVYEANCQYSGICRQKLFFYQPSTFAINNGEFVRSTVQTFYNNTVAGSCIPDIDTAAVLEANKHNLDKCAAVKLNILVTCIQAVRVMMDSMLELWFYISKLMMLLMQLMSPISAAGMQQSIATQLSALLKLIMNKFLALLKEAGNLIYKVIMNGPLGKYLQGVIKLMCEFLAWLFKNVIHVMLCWMRMYLLILLRYVAMPLVDILNGVAFGKLGYLREGVNIAIDLVEKNVPCDDKALFTCSIGEDEVDDTTGLLPNPTRCWAGVEPGIGSLGCSASDTCMDDNYGLIACGACKGASHMIKYGCNTLTKLCSCNVFPVGITACNSHQECTMEGASVDCQYVDSYLQPSYGNVPCQQCANPICLVSDGSGVGQCSCLLRPVSSQRCTSVGERVSPNAAELCLVASDSLVSTKIRTSNSYTADYRTLASAPCMILNQGSTYCMQVFTSASVSMPLVVGGSVLLGRRRMLLSVGSDQPLLSNVSIWEGEGEPCRSLVLSSEMGLGILEKYVASECWRWRDIGAQIVETENMTAVSPFFLVSWRDLLSAMLHPESMIQVLAKAPSVISKMLLHAEIAQPIYVAILYYSALIPEDLWRNGTFVDQVRSFFINRTITASLGDFVVMGLPAVLVPGMVANGSFQGNTTNTTAENITNVTLLSQHRRVLMGIQTQPDVDTVYLWSQGPYPWPPNYDYWSSPNGGATCAVVNTALDVFKNGLNITMMYYSTPRTEPIQSEFPSLPLISMASWSLPSVPEKMWDAVEWMWAVSKTFVNETSIVNFLDSAPYMSTARTLVKCDFIQVQTCSDRRDLVSTAVNVFVAFVIATLLARIMGIPFVELVVLVFYIPSVMYFAYGYNTLTCFPLIPTCLLEDVLSVIDRFIPDKIQWPDELVTTTNCTQASCLRSCLSDPNVGFNSVADHFAWSLCEIDPPYCVQLGATTSWTYIKASLIRKGALYPVSASMRSAQRICFSVTIVNSIPLLLLFSLLTSFFPVIVGICSALWQYAFSVVVTVFMFVHASVMPE